MNTHQIATVKDIISILQMINAGSYPFMISYQYCTTSRLREMGMRSPFLPNELRVIVFIGWPVVVTHTMDVQQTRFNYY